MSAVVCGKRSLLDDLHGSPPVPKRLRCGGGGGGSSPRFSPVGLWRNDPGAGGPFDSGVARDQLLQLRAHFPDMDGQLLEKVLESCDNDLDSAIKSLCDLRLSSSERVLTSGVTAECSAGSLIELGQDVSSTETLGVGMTAIDKHYLDSVSAFDRSEWVDLFVREMLSASDLDDAKAYATRALQALEKTVLAGSGAVLEALQKEHAAFKGQLQGLLRDNHILKRAVAVQHERQLEHEECSRELRHVKQLLTQYQEQIRTLELNNYALNLHLRKAQEGTSIPGRFHPDVF